jgi:hypothetical protein
VHRHALRATGAGQAAAVCGGHANQKSHGLETIAERLRVDGVGRHTALGDATVPDEVFLKLLRLLHAAGIRTLCQAPEAAQKTLYAGAVLACDDPPKGKTSCPAARNGRNWMAPD